jgi:hypothetical protein
VPVSCSTNVAVLTGSDGAFAYKPSGTTACLLDNTDFTVLGSKVKLPPTHGFMPGDPVVFKEENGGTLDSGLTAGTTYFLGAVTATDAVILSALGGAAVTLEGDGGTGTADTPGGHINMQFATYEALCQIAGFDLSMTRDKIETTSLRCNFGGTASKIVAFKTYQAGRADGTGTVRVQFTAATAGLGQRMLADTLRANQEGAWGKFYLNAVGSGAVDGGIDDAASNFVEVPLSLEGVALAVDSGGTEATVATVNFSFAGAPTHLFTTSLV